MIKVTALTQPTLRAMDRLFRDVSRPGPAMKLVGLVGQGFVQRRFKEGKDPRGEPWHELATATILRRRNKDKGSIKPLVDTGRLMNSINFRATSVEAIVGTNVIYSATHNFGDPSRNIPKREFMGVTPVEEQIILRRVDAWVSERVRAQGLR